jgi:hypothetical protein
MAPTQPRNDAHLRSSAICFNGECSFHFFSRYSRGIKLTGCPYRASSS